MKPSSATVLLLLASFAILSPVVVIADKWDSGSVPKPSSKTYLLGDATCHESTKSLTRPGQMMPRADYYFNCERNQKALFSLPFGAELISLSNDRQFAMGVSNHGLHDHAFWIINSQGKVIAERRHSRHGGSLEYCRQTITLIRKWFDKANPDVDFIVRDNQLLDVKINSCSKKRLSLKSVQPF